MKKILILVISIAMIVSMFGCSSTPASTTPSVMTTTPLGTTNKADTPTVPEIPSGNSTVITEAMLRSMPENPASDFTYANSIKVRDGIRIDSYTGSSDIVVIPATIDGKTVVEIADYVFANDSIVRAVYIPDSVEKISQLFANNKHIEIVIADGVKEISEFAFGSCSVLREVVLGNHLTMLDEYAFYACKSLIKVNISATLTAMTEKQAASAFFGCKNLTIYGEAGSYIEEICQQQGIPFVCE
jgi:hypothetical protein